MPITERLIIIPQKYTIRTLLSITQKSEKQNGNNWIGKCKNRIKKVILVLYVALVFKYPKLFEELPVIKEQDVPDSNEENDRQQTDASGFVFINCHLL